MILFLRNNNKNEVLIVLKLDHNCLEHEERAESVSVYGEVFISYNTTPGKGAI